MLFSNLPWLTTALALVHLSLPVQAIVRIRAGDNVLVGEQNTKEGMSKVQDLFFDDQHFWVKIGDTGTNFGRAFQCHIEGTGPKDRAEEFTFTQVPGKAKARIDKCGCWGGAFMHCDAKVECGTTGSC